VPLVRRKKDVIRDLAVPELEDGALAWDFGSGGAGEVRHGWCHHHQFQQQRRQQQQLQKQQQQQQRQQQQQPQQ
jgi:hypothetical protein